MSKTSNKSKVNQLLAWIAQKPNQIKLTIYKQSN